MNLTFKEEPAFQRVRDALFGGDEGYRTFQNVLISNPRIGDVIPGAGGVRKVRVKKAGSDQGKSGGIRVIYLYREEKATIILYAAYAKNVADNLNPEQLKAIRKAVQNEKVRS